MSSGFFASFSNVWMICDHNAMQISDSTTDQNQTLDLLQLHIKRQEWDFLGPWSLSRLFLYMFCAKNRVEQRHCFHLTLIFNEADQMCFMCLRVTECTVKEERGWEKRLFPLNLDFNEVTLFSMLKSLFEHNINKILRSLLSLYLTPTSFNKLRKCPILNENNY